jgi:predicted outer membrane repeat protein
MINCRTATQERPPHPVRGPMLTALGLVLGLTLLVSEAGAATYRVYTNTAASSMNVNANDGQCSLAEAVLHVNGQNGNTTYCTNAAPGSPEHRIELLQSPNRPYATNHFQITSLTITTTTRVSISGFGAFIDSARIPPAFVYSAFVIGARGAPPSQRPTVFFERVTLTNISGSSGGRLVENFGTLQLYGVTITKGDATGSQHTTGRGGGIFNAGTISLAQNSLISENKARQGGGVYNDAGIISDLAVNISKNTATMAGGGIYNISTSPGPDGPTNGTINAVALSLTENSAPAGGGVFNRGEINLRSSSIRGNYTSGTGSDETCLVSNGIMQPPGTTSCDGSGGGVLSAHQSGAATRFQLVEGSDFSNNTASLRGGAVFCTGVLELGGMTMNGNRAQTGAAIYAVGPTDGTGEYCNVLADDGHNVGPTTINGNIASAGYSIVSGGSPTMRRCFLGGCRLRGSRRAF